MMDWIYNHLLMPVLGILYVPCDWVLGWTERFSPVVAISIVGVLSGLASILIQKYASDQRLLGQCKEDIDLLKKKSKAAKAEGRMEALLRARALSGRIGMKRFWATLKPSLWTVPMFLVIAFWAGSRLGYLPIRPGQDVTVAAHFESQAKGFAYVLPSDAFTLVSPPIAPLETSHCLAGSDQTDPHATWVLRAQKDGDYKLTVRGGGKSYELALPVAAKGGRPPDPVTPIQETSPGQDQLQAIEVKLVDSIPARWWNLKLQWGGLYIVVALGAWLAFRWALRVH